MLPDFPKPIPDCIVAWACSNFLAQHFCSSSFDLSVDVSFIEWHLPFHHFKFSLHHYHTSYNSCTYLLETSLHQVNFNTVCSPGSGDTLHQLHVRSLGRFQTQFDTVNSLKKGLRMINYSPLWAGYWFVERPASRSQIQGSECGLNNPV